MCSMRITSQTFLRADLENLLNAISRAQRRTGRGATAADDYTHGFADALEAVATALSISLERSPSRSGRRRS